MTLKQRFKLAGLVLAISAVAIAVFVIPHIATEFKEQAAAEDEAESGVRRYPEQPGQVYPPPGTCPILQTLSIAWKSGESTWDSNNGGVFTESSYRWTYGHFCVDKTQHVSFLLHDGRLDPLTPGATAFNTAGWVLLALNRAEWVQFLSEHPADGEVVAVEGLCKEGISVRTNEGRDLVGMENDGTYKAFYFTDACRAGFSRLTNVPAQPAPLSISTAQAIKQFPPEFTISNDQLGVALKVEGRFIQEYEDPKISSLPTHDTIECSNGGKYCYETATLEPTETGDTTAVIGRDGALFAEQGAADMNVIKPLEIGRNRYVVIDWSELGSGNYQVVAEGLTKDCYKRTITINSLQHTVSTSDDAKSCNDASLPPKSNGLMLSKDFSITTAVQSTPSNAPIQLIPVSTAAAESEPEAASAGNIEVEVSRALENWAKAQESNDPALLANCYADKIDRYFLRQNVTNTFVHDYMDAWFKEHDSRVTMFRFKDVTYENVSALTAQLRLVKQVVVKDSKGSTERSTPSELYLKKVDGGWKITSERDFK